MLVHVVSVLIAFRLEEPRAELRAPLVVDTFCGPSIASAAGLRYVGRVHLRRVGGFICVASHPRLPLSKVRLIYTLACQLVKHFIWPFGVESCLELACTFSC